MTVALILLATVAGAAEPQHASVSFLVSAANPARNVSSGDLRRIFLGQITRWNDGHRIILFVGPPDSESARLFFDRVVRMSDIDYSQWWLGAVFRGRAANAPRVIAGVVTPPPVEPGVAVLTIDGKEPSDLQYPVRDR